MQNRTSFSIKNSTIALFAQIINIIISFITRTVFIYTLGADYLGINGLFTNVLSMLSLAEMGLGTAIIYAMYRPLAIGDEKKTSALMNLYAKAYRIIGLIIGIIGILLIPFLDYLINDQPNIPHLTIIYLLFLTNTVISYFFTYKRSIIIASQHGYINTINQLTFLIIQNIVQITLLIVFKQYLLYLMVQIVCTLSSNVAISTKADKMFPYLKRNQKERVDKQTKRQITKNVLAMMSNKIGSVVVTGTDNILIAAFVGIYWVGLYSNYVLIVTTIKSLIMQIMNAITASVGNLVASENNLKSFDIFKKIFFVNFVMTTFCSIFLYILLNPFIYLWIGQNYLLDENLVILIVANFFIIQMRQPAIVFIDTYGLFWQIKWKSLCEAGINLVVSLILLISFGLGIKGVLLGTLISNLLTNVWWEPLVTFEHGFRIKLREYFKLYSKYVMVALIAGLLTAYFCGFINSVGFVGIAFRAILCLIIPGFTIILMFHKTNEYRNVIVLVKALMVRSDKK